MTILAPTGLALALGLAVQSTLAVSVSLHGTRTQELVRPRCIVHYRVAPGEDCVHILEKHPYSFTLDQLYTWNPEINDSCTNLQVGDVICIQRTRCEECPTPKPTASGS
ncbi:hypothetical protein POX_f08035 [Penicillium oxalicum]|uniref:Peptidoglycan binding domain-containing protein n=1 Tax=Penicillium oxalicum (strain 114-2 / CGMCC 5302) TaxID=933388 RepID=S7ZF98_PENO1|nr:hypothetical protein POX_f08035 [Penicillium oxalicum]EPS28959.1 peptidoglycan binding domain-containing protein [Penicillium oxalicum 114-2]KAI2787660.1 hypothetical protein POX_f08035 [Penicillium oxalicum]